MPAACAVRHPPGKTGTGSLPTPRIRPSRWRIDFGGNLEPSCFVAAEPTWMTSSLSERVVILRNGGGKAAGATKNLAIRSHLTAEKRDSSAPSGPQNDKIDGVLPRWFSLRQAARWLSSMLWRDSQAPLGLAATPERRRTAAPSEQRTRFGGLRAARSPACPCPKPLTAECVLPLEDLRVLGELGGLMLLAEPWVDVFHIENCCPPRIPVWVSPLSVV